jgi:glycosyltransferase involved in cell wall biosynthesis
VVSRRFVFAVPGDLATPTGGYAYDRRMIAELENLGWRVDVLDVGSDFPRPRAAAKAAARTRLEAVPHGACIVIDGLAFGVLPEAAAALARSHKLVALVHHPLALESGLSSPEADAMRESERAALAATRHVIVNSPATARLLVQDYAVVAEKITIVLPGTDRVAHAPRRHEGAISLLSVGSLVPRKGYDVLLDALAQIAELPWNLTIVGDPTRNAATAAEIDARIGALNFARRVTLAGAVSAGRLAELYAQADLFVLASRHEGYGMAFTEAIAHGVPVVGTTAGAIPETVPPDAGVLVPPNDAAGLAAALRRLIGSENQRRRLTEGAQAAAAQLPTWAQSAQAFSSALEAIR